MMLKVDGALNRVNFSAAHFIPSIEKCSRLHGHDYSISLELEGIPQDSILIDYGIVKSAMRKAIEDMDHKVLLPTSSSLSEVRCDSRACIVRYSGKEFVFPVGDSFMLSREVTSSEMIADFILERVGGMLKPYRNLSRLQICVYEGPGQCTCQEKMLDE